MSCYIKNLKVINVNFVMYRGASYTYKYTFSSELDTISLDVKFKVVSSTGVEYTPNIRREGLEVFVTFPPGIFVDAEWQSAEFTMFVQSGNYFSKVVATGSINLQGV